MDQILKTVFDHTKPKYISFQTTEMINVGLVLKGVKPGALLALDDVGVRALRDAGLYVEPYALVQNVDLVFVSRKNPKFPKNTTHADIGRALGYLTPINIESNKESFRNTYNAKIEVLFQRNKGRKLKAYLMGQKVIGKTEYEILHYMKPFAEAIQTMELPSEFKIFKVEIVIEKLI
jgi:hypothetical protein